MARGVGDVRVLALEVAAVTLAAMATLDLTLLRDAEANQWLYAHSEWASSTRLAHGHDHVIRGTNNGRSEHYFTPAAFAHFRAVP